MELQKITNLIQICEHRFPVEQWKVNGIHIWPLLRFFFVFEQNKKIAKPRIKEPPSTNMKLKNFRKYLQFVIKDHSHRQKLNKSESQMVFLGRSTLRNIRIGKRFYSPIADTFKDALDSLGHPTLLLEFDPLWYFPFPKYFPSKSIQVNILFASIKTHIQKFLKKSLNLDLPQFDQFIATLKENNVQIVERDTLIYQTLKLRNLANYFKKILRKVKPPICFSVPYYIPEGLALNLACSELNIPSVDVQHGVQIGHIAYNYNSKSPKGGYSVLPDYFWVWSESEKKMIEKWTIFHDNSPRVYVGGNLWIQIWRNKSHKIVRSFKIKDNLFESSTKKNILVSLQPAVDPSIIFDAMSLTNNNYQWWVRLHPLMIEQSSHYNSILKKRGLSNYNLNDASELPLNYLLSYMNIHVTAYSSVVLEAESFGVPSICIDKKAKILYPHQIESQMVIQAENGEEILEKIEKLREDSPSKEEVEKKIKDPIDIVEKFLNFVQTNRVKG